MCETCRLPTASLRAPNRQPVIPLPIAARQETIVRPYERGIVPSQSPRAHQETMPNSRSAEFGKILQKATGFDEPQRKLVPARAHAREGQRRSVGLLSARLAPSPQRIGRIPWNCSLRAVMPTDRTEPLWRLFTCSQAGVKVTSGRPLAVRNISYHGSAAS